MMSSMHRQSRHLKGWMLEGLNNGVDRTNEAVNNALKGVKRVLETDNDCHVFIIMALSCVVVLLIIAIIFF